MSNQSSTLNDKPRTVQDIINEIEQKSKGGSYIYRGESKLHKEHPYNGKVSSNLWREYCIEEEEFDIEIVQRSMLNAARKHVGHQYQDSQSDPAELSDLAKHVSDITTNFEILTELQHYGGKTNLIDFTTDYFIAIFFACDSPTNEDGRVILLQKTNEIENIIMRPQNPPHRVIAQKSVFIRPPKGFIEPSEEQIVVIPKHLKQLLLKHLRDYHGIFTEVIYNDIHGYIRNQNIHGDTYTHFYKGYVCGNRGDEAATPEKKQQEYEEAIKHYTEAIELKPDLAVAYSNRGEIWLHLQEWEKAKSDFITAKDMGVDIIASFHNDYESVADFEQKHNVKLPEDIASLLNPPPA